MKKTNKALKAVIITVATMASLLLCGLIGVSAAETEPTEPAEIQQLLGEPLVIEEEPAEEPAEVEAAAWWLGDEFAPKVQVTEPTTEPIPEPTDVEEEYTEPTTVPTDPTDPTDPTEPTEPPTTPEPTEPTTPEPTPDPVPDVPSDNGGGTEDYYPTPTMDVLGAVKTGEGNSLNVLLACVMLAALIVFVFLTFSRRREDETRRYQPRHMKR